MIPNFRQNHYNPQDMVVLFYHELMYSVCMLIWKKTLKLIRSCSPFLLTTNTEMEGVVDCQYLYPHDLIVQ